MGYLHIDNLQRRLDLYAEYRGRDMYALEKIDGTSASISLARGASTLELSPGCGSLHTFKAWVGLRPSILPVLQELLEQNPDAHTVTLFGEIYGGKIQKMRESYGEAQRFIGFDVRMDEDRWLSVPECADVCQRADVPMVAWEIVPFTVEELDRVRYKDSTLALQMGCGAKMREGIVVRPIAEEVRRGRRVIFKFKRPEFSERSSCMDTTLLTQVLTNAATIVDEWVTPMRLAHVLDKLPTVGIEQTSEVVGAMVEDVRREAGDEIVWAPDLERCIAAHTVKLYKAHLARR